MSKTALAIIICLAGVSLLACEEYGSGEIWARNESAVDVLVRVSHVRGATIMPAQGVWLVDHESEGIVVFGINNAFIEVLDPASCRVLGSASIHHYIMRVSVAADATVSIDKQGSVTDQTREYQPDERCRG